MKINKPLKVVIGVATGLAAIVPFAIAPLMMGMMFAFGGFPFSVAGGFNPDFMERFFPLFFFTVFPLITCSSLVQLALQVFYIAHILNNGRVVGSSRTLFVLGAFFMPYIVMPLYFFLYVWRDPDSGPMPDQPSNLATPS